MCRSASWSARLRALPSSPSLPAASGAASNDHHVRRHTTQDAAHPSHHANQQHTGQGDRHTSGSVAHSGSQPVTSTADKQHSHSPAVALEESPAPAGSAAKADLLSLVPDDSEWHNDFKDAEAGPQHANGFTYGSSTPIKGPAGLASLTAESQHLSQGEETSGNQDLNFSQTFVLTSSQLPEEQFGDDPFHHSVAFSAGLSQSSKQFSDLSALTDPRGSDLDSWGSFLLPDETSNAMEESLAQEMVDQKAGSACCQSIQTERVVLTATPPELQLPLKVESAVDPSQHHSQADLSPDAGITSKQRLQLDLFLQSSSSRQ